ncbi:MAG: sigma 54-interacting transcriptional regulator [Desulfobacteraceae bacterium]|nr:sigma 54-interacting transcriptional regulator [Desulfobacteraceae bacterium]MBC2752748.1 sigma 54-interacting transcriptional regulator [Desulfobacteraceae bacterium]
MRKNVEKQSRPRTAELGEPFQDSPILKYISADLIESLIDNPYESLILVDADGIVRFMNNSYEQEYSRRREDAIGRHISEIAPETLLPEVLRTGKVIVTPSKILEDKSQIVIRVPLRKEGKLTGALAKVIYAPPKALQDFARKISALEQDLEVYKEEFRQAYSSRYTFDDIIGETDAVNNAKDLAKQFAQSDSAVLILGESGSGKELFAHAIHSASHRRNKPFVSVNCTAIPNELIESELFGYEPGAFTGSLKKGKIGKFELADTGTIHLDEIGDMPYLLQSKLLRVLQEHEIDKIGQRKPKHVDFRLICTTNQPLEQMVEKGTFRLDLFYRLNVVVISVPPLRAIKADIPGMVYYFLRHLETGRANPVKTVSGQVMKILQKYHWPGNVRELKNVLERAIVVCRGDRIEVDDLPPAMIHTRPGNLSSGNQAVVPQTIKEVVESAERAAIIQALELNRNNKSAAAKMLGIHRTALYQKIEKFNISF